MKKLSVFVLIIIICVISLFGCTTKMFYDMEVIWVSDNPEIVFSFDTYKLDEYMIINGIKKNIYASPLSIGSNTFYLYDKDGDIHEKELIWECSVDWKKNSNTMKVTVVKDTLYGYEGKTIIFKSKPIPEEHTIPSDNTISHSYKNAASLVRKLYIPEEIKCVFEDSKTCYFEGKKISLSELGKIAWWDFYEYDINSDGNNELFVTIFDKEYALIMFSVIEDEVQLDYIVKEGMNEMYEDGVIRLGEEYYKIEITSDRKISINKITANNNNYINLKSYGIRN